MKKISEFAMLCGTSAKTLRFYEKIGLLKASYVDPENGYRYYNENQENQYEKITVFKEIGFTLEEIKKDVLLADDAHILATLRQKEGELQKALKICAEQIACYENSLQNISQEESCGITLRRDNNEGKIVVSDGSVIRTFTCASDRMDTCAKVIQDLFCVPDYVNLSLSHIPVFDEDRSVLVQVLEGTKEEILSTDYGTMFDKSANIPAVSTVLMAITMAHETTTEEIKRIVSKCISQYSDSCAAIWGVRFDDRSGELVKVCTIGVY